MTEKKITRRVFVTWENHRKFKFQCRSMKLCLHTIAYVELSDCNRYHCGLQNLECSPSGTLQTWADPRQRLEGRWGTFQMLWALARFLSAFVPGWPLFVLGLGSCCTHPSVLFAQGCLSQSPDCHWEGAVKAHFLKSYFFLVTKLHLCSLSKGKHHKKWQENINHW